MKTLDNLVRYFICEICKWLGYSARKRYESALNRPHLGSRERPTVRRNRCALRHDPITFTLAEHLPTSTSLKLANMRSQLLQRSTSYGLDQLPNIDDSLASILKFHARLDPLPP